MRHVTRAPLLCIALLSACSESFVVPDVERSLPDVPVAKPALRVLGSWAYLMSPAVRIAISANALGNRQAEARIPDLVASITESSVEVEPAALVGVYVTDDRKLLLNAAGGYSLTEGNGPQKSHEQGTWSVKGSELWLHGQQQTTKQLSLTPSADMLRWEDQVFQPAAAPPNRPSNPDLLEGDEQ